MTKDDERFNGWANHETWAVSLWLFNDEGLYDTARECVRSRSDDNAAKIADNLRDMVRDLAADAGITDKATLWSDLVGYALDRCDWDEIAAAFTEDRD